MNEPATSTNGMHWNQESFLLFCIVLFTLLAIVMTLFTFYNRHRRQRSTRRKAIYQPFIEELMFTYLFDDSGIDQILENPQFIAGFEKRLFKKLMMKNIIILHKQYSGEYRQKLELLYFESGLVAFSEKKLHSRRWNELVVAIRDLSEMNAHQHYDRITALTRHPNHLVQLEAITALIRLKGPAALQVLDNYPEKLNNWVQANIFHAIKLHTVSEVPDFGFLLYNTNPTVVVLGLRLTGHFTQVEHMPRIRELRKMRSEEYFREAIHYAEEKLTPYL